MYPNLLAALIENTEGYTWTDDDLGKLASGNLIRVFKEVEAVRDSLADEAPYQSWIPKEDFAEEETGCMTQVEWSQECRRSSI